MASLDDRINGGDVVMVVRYGSSRLEPIEIEWTGMATIDLGNGMQTMPVALGTDNAGRDLVFARNWDVPVSDRDAFVDLVGRKTRDWTDIGGCDLSPDIASRIEAAIQGLRL